MTGTRPADTERVDLPITGMTCASCANRIEKTLRKAVGVSDATVNLATERATVHFDPAITGLDNIVGFAELKKKFIVAVVLGLPVFVMAMAHGRIDFLNFPGAGWLQLILTTPVVFYSGAQFFKAAWGAAREFSSVA